MLTVAGRTLQSHLAGMQSHPCHHLRALEGTSEHSLFGRSGGGGRGWKIWCHWGREKGRGGGRGGGRGEGRGVGSRSVVNKDSAVTYKCACFNFRGVYNLWISGKKRQCTVRTLVPRKTPKTCLSISHHIINTHHQYIFSPLDISRDQGWVGPQHRQIAPNG